MNRPNILYIHSHDTGRHISPFGHAVPTPNLQKLAEDGILFRQAFCASPSCSPSRAALLTGQSAHSSGMLGLAHRGWKLHDYGQHLIHTLGKAGYESTLCGVQHIAAGPDSVKIIGYDGHIATPSMRARDVAPAAAQWLENAPDEPFFLDVGFVETHTLPGESLFDCGVGDPRYVLPPAPLPDTSRNRQDIADFKESARVLDEGIGQVLAALEESGRAENTLVICTTDHGIPLPAMKCNLTDAGTGVMLILRGPNGFQGGQVVDAMVSHIDVFPSLCEYLDIEKPDWLQGRSFLPVVRGASEGVNDEIFSEITHHAAYEPMRSVRTKRWKYIRQMSERGKPVLPNCDDSRSKDVWVEAGWREKTVAAEQLFDLLFDPNETNNLAHEAELSPVLEEMRARLESWMERTEDPILSGPVPVPEGTVEKSPDDLSPKTTGK
ncbi:MAG: sulfatase [Armatimonadetes bacterium]|nr:sulfatase [Armatimonadota bacterium]